MAVWPRGPTDDALDTGRAAESNLERILATTGTIHAIALVSVLCRIYTRLVLVKSFGRDDVLIIAAAAIGFGGGMIPISLEGHHGLGRHIEVIPKHDQIEFGRLAFVQSLTATLTAMACLKVSVGFSLLRLTANRRYSRVVWGLIVFVCAYTVVAWCSILFFCTPISGFWNRDLKPSCYAQELYNFFAWFNSSSNAFTDFCFSSLPIPLIWTLRLRRRLRVYLISILGLGYIAMCLGITKAVCQSIFRHDPDRYFNNWIQFFGFLELNVGIIAACAPTLRPLLGRWLGLRGSSTEDDRNVKRSIYDRQTRRSPRRLSAGTSGYLKSESADGEFELAGRYTPHFRSDVEGQSRTSVHGGGGGSFGVADTPGDGSWSRDPILGESLRQSGILKSMEVSVTRN